MTSYFNHGIISAKLGLPKSSCPFEGQKKEWWEDGYLAAFMERLDKYGRPKSRLIDYWTYEQARHQILSCYMERNRVQTSETNKKS